MVSFYIGAKTENKWPVAEPDHRKDFMGECDQAASETILDFFYEQVSLLKLLYEELLRLFIHCSCKFINQVLTSCLGRLVGHDKTVRGYIRRVDH